MPIEIKELIIKTTVADNTTAKKESRNVRQNELRALKESILRECKAYLDEKITDANRR